MLKHKYYGIERVTKLFVVINRLYFYVVGNW